MVKSTIVVSRKWISHLYILRNDNTLTDHCRVIFQQSFKSSYYRVHFFFIKTLFTHNILRKFPTHSNNATFSWRILEYTDWIMWGLLSIETDCVKVRIIVSTWERSDASTSLSGLKLVPSNSMLSVIILRAVFLEGSYPSSGGIKSDYSKQCQ